MIDKPSGDDTATPCFSDRSCPTERFTRLVRSSRYGARLSMMPPRSAKGAVRLRRNYMKQDLEAAFAPQCERN